MPGRRTRSYLNAMSKAFPCQPSSGLSTTRKSSRTSSWSSQRTTTVLAASPSLKLSRRTLACTAARRPTLQERLQRPENSWLQVSTRECFYIHVFDIAAEWSSMGDCRSGWGGCGCVSLCRKSPKNNCSLISWPMWFCLFYLKRLGSVFKKCIYILFCIHQLLC